MSEEKTLSKPRKKRFIAGAVCPECKQLDKIIMYPDEQKVECVNCEYEELMDENSEPESNVKEADSASVIRFVDPK